MSTRPCQQCGHQFPIHGTRRRTCDACKAENYQAKLAALRVNATWRHEKLRGRMQHIEPRRAPVTMRPDFLLAFPEMRAELLRQVGGPMSMPKVATWEPGELPSFGRPLRGRQGAV